MVRYIHSLSTTLRWRKYRENILTITAGVIIVGVLVVNVGNVKKGINISKTNKSIEILETKTDKISKDIKNLREDIENEEEFIEFKDSTNKLNAIDIPKMYEVDKIYEYLHGVPETIKVGKISVGKDVTYIKGQATSYKQLEMYREELKRSKLFHFIELKEVDYISTGDYIQFELRCLVREVNENERVELERKESEDK